MTNNEQWTYKFRILTPILLFSLNLLAGMMISNQVDLKIKMEDINQKIFHHLTNAEIHIPRDYVVSKSEYQIICNIVDKERDETNRKLETIMQDLKDIIRKK